MSTVHARAFRRAEDLDGAEGLLGRLDRTLREVLADPRLKMGNTDRRRLMGLLRETMTYCRPSCALHGIPHPDDGRPGGGFDCDCPCHRGGFV